jgi:formate/nitrite transporter FocA (FNT family)
MSNDKIQRLREKGHWSFIIKYGVLILGIGSSLLVSIAIPLVTEVEYTFTQLLAISLPTLCVAGILFGHLMWRIIVAYDPDTNAEQGGAGQPPTRSESE